MITSILVVTAVSVALVVVYKKLSATVAPVVQAVTADVKADVDLVEKAAEDSAQEAKAVVTEAETKV